jgi:hypothetical protein
MTSRRKIIIGGTARLAGDVITQNSISNNPASRLSEAEKATDEKSRHSLIAVRRLDLQ